MAISLPTKLKKEPLIDAIFEVRFDSNIPASVILPGVFFNDLVGHKSIETLATAQLPKALRDADPNLRFAAINKIDWDNFFINIGDFNVSISCKYPYPGWATFKNGIIEIVKILQKSGIVKNVERYSLKYVDLLPVVNGKSNASMLNMSIGIAGHTLKDESFQFRIEILKDELIHAVQLVSSAKAVLHTGLVKDGLIVDVDTLAILHNTSLSSLVEGIENKLDVIHAANKKMFFDCLNPETLTSLEPTYE
jgi:uncharacterized protein (TIGR04255 family)